MHAYEQAAAVTSSHPQPSPSPSSPGLRRRTFTSTRTASSIKSRSLSDQAHACPALGGQRSAKLAVRLRLRLARGAAASERRARESDSERPPPGRRPVACSTLFACVWLWIVLITTALVAESETYVPFLPQRDSGDRP